MTTNGAIDLVEAGQMAAMPLFSNVDMTLLKQLALHARCTSYRKGDFILRSGEVTNRFFVMISGWVGVRRNNVYGEESVLDVLEKGRAFPSYRLDGHHTCSTDVVALCDCRILSMPYIHLTELYDRSPAFAKKLLSMAQESLSRATDHVEQLTLRTAEQRVGAFLLRLKLDAGESCNSFELPFEKVVIASYLGIKPETFSRSLQNLKENGIQVSRQVITIPDEHALCAFCDQRLSRNCEHANTESCGNPSSDMISIKLDNLR